jgi:hypothetical protein
MRSYSAVLAELAQFQTDPGLSKVVCAKSEVPKGNVRGGDFNVSRPFGTRHPPRIPGVETPGYCRSSLRDFGWERKEVWGKMRHLEVLGVILTKSKSRVERRIGVLIKHVRILALFLTGNWKVPLTRRLESLRHVAQTFLSAGSGDFPVARSIVLRFNSRTVSGCAH